MNDLNLYRRFLDESSDPVFSLDPDYRYVYANRAFADGIGKDLDEVIGKTLWDVFSESEAARRFASVKWVFDHKESKVLELLISRPDGDHFYLTTLKPILDNQGKVSAVLANSKDISKRRQVEQQLETSRERLQLALSGGELGLWDWNIASGIVLYSDHWFSMLGLPMGDAKLGLDSWTKLIHPDDLASVNEALESHLKGLVPTYECEHRVRHQDGRWLWLLDRGKVVEWDKAGTPVRAVGTYFDITQRKQTELKLITVMNAVQASSDAIGISDANGHHYFQNKAFTELYGYATAKELESAGGGAVTVKDSAIATEIYERIMSGNSWSGELELVTKSGRIFSGYERADAIKDNEGKIIGLIGIITDITEQKRLSEALRESEERWKFALESSGDGVWDWNVQAGEVNYSRPWKEMLGYADSEIGNSLDEWKRLLHPDDLAGALATIQEYFREEIPEYVVEHRLLCKDASWKWVLSRGMIISRTPDGKPLRMIGTHVDITERKDAELQIAFVAHHDRLTGLSNRSLFFDRFSQAISQAKRNNKRVALLFVDLDGFKPVNDNYGHESGDIVLKIVAERMLSSVRAMDTVARMGGDEFVVILGELDSSTEAEPVAIKLLEALAQMISLPGRADCAISACIGISIYPDNGTEMDTLLAAADTAMYQSKHRGTGQYTFFLNAESPEETVSDWILFDERHVVGIDEVDEQHEHLIALLNCLNKAIRGNEDRDSIENHLKKLTEYTKFHFDTEHDLMERYNYPGKRDHDMAHGRLLADALHFKTRMNRGGDLLVLQSIKDWLLNHIPVDDKPLAEFLKGKLPPGGRSLV